jgi:sugar lactone lactonase YvrE
MVRGAPIHGANGLAVAPDGHLLVASVFGGELVALDTHSGAIAYRLGHADGVDGPDDVAVGPDGSIYWTDIMLGEVGRRAPDGTVTKQKVAPGMNPIAFDAQGRLFVGQAFFGDGLYELDPLTLAVKQVVIADSGVPPYVDQLNGFDFGPDGLLYAPQPLQGKVVRINIDTGDMQTITAAFPTNPPTSVEFNARGQLFASLSAGAVVRIDTTTGDYRKVTQVSGVSLDNMVFDSSDHLFVSDSDGGGVYAVTRGGYARMLSRGGLILPGGMALMRGNRGRDSLYVADVWRLVRFDAQSSRLLGSDVSAPVGGAIVQPWTVAPDGQNLIITSWMANAVQIWDPTAHTAVSTYTDFAVPLNAIRFQGDLVVAGNPGAGTGTVVRQDSAGTKTALAAGLIVPAGMAATDNDLWVADWATGVVWTVVSDGVVLPQPQVLTAGLQLPEGMAVDRDGSVLVVESGTGRLLRIDPDNGQVRTVVDGLATGRPGSADAPPTWALSSVVVGRHGTLFVTGDDASVAYRLRPVN